MMPTTKSQGQAIAHLMSELRPDWDYAGCLAAVGAVKHKHPLDVAMAAMRVCSKAEANTPGVLKAEGSHWAEKIAPAVHRQPPKKHEQCPRHPGEWHDACRLCASERAADEPPAPVVRPDAATEPPDFYKAARAQIRPHLPPAGGTSTEGAEQC